MADDLEMGKMVKIIMENVFVMGKMKSRNLRVRKVLKALKDYGCVEIRNTSHGIIMENPKKNKSTNVPTHQDILPVWIYKNILK